MADSFDTTIEIGERNPRLMESHLVEVLPNLKINPSITMKNVLHIPELFYRLPYSVVASKSPMEVLFSFYPNVTTLNNLIPIYLGVYCLSMSLVVLVENLILKP